MYSLDFPYAYEKPATNACFRFSPEDFIVDEIFDFEPSGEGEHLYLHVKKTGENTQYLADALAQFFGVKKMDVGFAGMKDRNAITSQWFSIYLPGRAEAFDSQQLINDCQLNIEVLDSQRHNKKLRRGDHNGNRFVITLRNIQENQDTEQRLIKVAGSGVPNYFGEQRFGREMSNLQQFAAHVEKVKRQGDVPRPRSRKKRKGGDRRNSTSMLISAARSYLFNLVLGERVAQNNWEAPSLSEQEPDPQTTGPLWGRGRLTSCGDILALEERVLAPFHEWCHTLEHTGLSQERRPLVLQPQALQWHWHKDNLTLKFQLQPGEFATSVLREICLLEAPING